MNYNHAGMYRDAEQVLRQALEIVPNQTQAHYECGFALLQQQRSKEAIEYFRGAVKSNPQNVMAYHFLGYSLVGHELDLFAARKLLKELESLYPAQAKEVERLISLNEPSDSKM